MVLRKNNKLLSIVIPVYNSEKTIKKVVKKAVETLKTKIDYEIILVNDGSEDDSHKKCIELTEENKYISFINLSKNFGQHNAIMAGLHFVKGDYILFMDDDLQTSPEEAWKLIDKIEEGHDVVYANYKERQYSKFRHFGSNLRDSMANIIFKKPKDIRITSYFIIRKYIADEIIKYTGPFSFLSGLILRVTGNIGNVYVSHYKRKYGKTNYIFKRLVRHWVNGLINFTAKPLRVSFLLGLFCFIIALAFSVFLLVKKILDPNLILGWTSTILAIILFSSLQLIIIGVLGEYIGRIFLLQNKQPQYVIKEKYNLTEKEKSGLK